MRAHISVGNFRSSVSVVGIANASKKRSCHFLKGAGKNRSVHNLSASSHFHEYNRGTSWQQRPETNELCRRFSMVATEEDFQQVDTSQKKGLRPNGTTIIQQNPNQELNEHDSKHGENSTCEDHQIKSQLYEQHTLSSSEHQHQDQHGQNNHEHVCLDEYEINNIPLPPPLPEPKYSFHRRVLPSTLTQFSSPKGRQLFQESLMNTTTILPQEKTIETDSSLKTIKSNAEAYFPLAEQFLNQSDPAYCGITTLLMIFNAFGIDPNIRWKGGWRWYGSENMILESCCIPAERVRRVGISMEEFASLARCHGLSAIELKRPFQLNDNDSDESQNNFEDKREKIRMKKDREFYSLEEFRTNIITMVQNPPLYEHEDEDETIGRQQSQSSGGFMVVSFARSALGQTGDGHFSPIAAYHESSDQCLVLDVARFKYAPYWVSVKDLYEAMKPIDETTGKSRGWFMMYHHETLQHDRSLSSSSSSSIKIDADGNNKARRVTKVKGLKAIDEAKRPADIVPLSGSNKDCDDNVVVDSFSSVSSRREVCPVGDVKQKYCSVSSHRISTV